MATFSPAELFLSGAEDGSDVVLTNDDFELLDEFVDGELFAVGEAQKGQTSLGSQAGPGAWAGAGAASTTGAASISGDATQATETGWSGAGAPKRSRRTKAEVEAYLEKHARRRKVSAEEMRSFLASRKKVMRKHDVEPSASAAAKSSSAGTAAAAAAVGVLSFGESPLRQRDLRIWKAVSHLLNGYDLDGLQSWLATSLSPHFVLRIADSNLPIMHGPKAFGVFCCAGLGAFPVYNVYSEIILPVDASIHISLLDEAKRCSPALAKTLTVDNTNSYEFISHFDGVRIYYQSLWDVIHNYAAKNPAFLSDGGPDGIPVTGNEVRELLFANCEKGIYSDFARITPQELPNAQSDGRTVLESRFTVLADANTGVVHACILVVNTLVCPALDDVGPGAS